MKLNISEFGKTVQGQEVMLYNLKNEFVDLEVISLGGIIKSIKTADKNNKYENIVLNYKNLNDYENDTFFYGCIVGRTSGRTKDGILKINNCVYELEKNNANNNLHGGTEGLNTKNWFGSAEIIDEKGIITLKYKSPHLESNFPAEVDFEVKYILEKNTLTIEYFGVPDRDTYINLTNHTYFNLSGDIKNTIKNNLLKVNAKGYGYVNNETLPIKMERENCFINFEKFEKLENILKMDHNQVKIVGEGIDHPFELSKNSEFDIELKDEESGRSLKVKTEEPVAVIYTGNFLDKKYNGICFETQDYPDVFNFMPEKSKIYNKDLKYNAKTIFYFN